MSEMPENNYEMNEELPNVTEEPAKETFNLKKEVFEWVYTILIALVIAFLIKGFLFDVVKVDGSSMYPTLVNNDRIIITKLGYKPQKQDIIILDSNYKNREEYYDSKEELGEELNAVEKFIDYQFNLPSNLKKIYYVKRVIALPGETIDLVDGKVWIDGEPLKEDYYDGITPIIDPTVEFPITVEEGHIFVMGDNRPHSSDSRSSTLGQVPVEAVLGKAQIRIWPLNTISFTK